MIKKNLQKYKRLVFSNFANLIKFEKTEIIEYK